MFSHLKFAPALLLLIFSSFKFPPVTPEALLKIPQSHLERYQFETNSNYIILKMGFNSEVIQNPEAIHTIKNKKIKSIELVYSDYRLVPDFDQPKLNSKRIYQLMKIAPCVFENTEIQWKFIAQTGCSNKYICQDFFHGFVIHYQETDPVEPPPSAATSKIKSGVPAKKKCRTYYLPVLKNKRDQGTLYSKRGILPRKKIIFCDDLDEEIKAPVPAAFSYEKKLKTDLSTFKDSVVTCVLKRNGNWKDMLLVIDVTSSMWPYSGQVLSWISLKDNNSKVGKYVFFNDGDMKPDHKKIPGKTGGVYPIKSGNQEEILNMMVRAMRNGYGGDTPENNVEAILKGLKKFPSKGEIILIADNNANMRDYKFIGKIKRPVRVILCGVRGPINTQYIDLAYKTGGSLHTIEDDFTELDQLKEGELLRIGHQLYSKSGKRFVNKISR